jgi:hypothetical protein
LTSFESSSISTRSLLESFRLKIPIFATLIYYLLCHLLYGPYKIEWSCGTQQH